MIFPLNPEFPTIKNDNNLTMNNWSGKGTTIYKYILVGKMDMVVNGLTLDRFAFDTISIEWQEIIY